MEDLITQLIETSLKRKGLPHLQPTPRSADEKREDSVLAPMKADGKITLIGK
jgi:hypothetical protein